MFEVVNEELQLLTQTWFNTNKLCQNVTKKSTVCFNSQVYANKIPLRLPTLQISNAKIKREPVMKFIDVASRCTLNRKTPHQLYLRQFSKTLLYYVKHDIYAIKNVQSNFTLHLFIHT